MRRSEVRRAQQRKQGLAIAVGTIALIALAAWIFASARRESSSHPAEVSQPVSTPTASGGADSSIPSRTASGTPPNTPSPPTGADQPSPSPLVHDSSATIFNPDLSEAGNVVRVQARLTELGYLNDFADGR